MGQAAISALVFVINVVFNLYILAVLLRVLLQKVKADFYNPICQFLMLITNVLVLPVRRIIPGFFGIDMASVVVAYLLQLLQLVIIGFIMSQPLSLFLLWVALINLIQMFLYIFIGAIVIRAIISWVNPDPRQPLVILLIQLTEPLLNPLRRFVPSFAGIDFTPLAALIILEVLLILSRGLL